MKEDAPTLIGPYKFTYKELAKEGVVVECADPILYVVVMSRNVSAACDLTAEYLLVGGCRTKGKLYFASAEPGSVMVTVKVKGGDTPVDETATVPMKDLMDGSIKQTRLDILRMSFDAEKLFAFVSLNLLR